MVSSSEPLRTHRAMTWVLMTCGPARAGIMINTVLGVRGLCPGLFDLYFLCDLVQVAFLGLWPQMLGEDHNVFSP